MRFYVYAALIGGIGANPERIFFILFDLSLFDHRPPRRLAVVIFSKPLKLWHLKTLFLPTSWEEVG